MSNNTCKCACGHTDFNVSGEPLFRMLCHCTICQKFNAAPHADILVYKTAQVTVPEPGVVNFSTYKRPPNVQRGKCAKCDQAAIEVFAMPLFPKLTMVPVKMLPDVVQLPEPKAHMFYDKRLSDAEDGYPKKQGFMLSQMAFFKYLWIASRK